MDMLTRGVLRGPTFYHFSYSCSCAAEKPLCIHIGLVIMKEFGETISDWFLSWTNVFRFADYTPNSWFKLSISKNHLVFTVMYLFFQMKFNLINLHDQIRDENSALKFLQDRDVIKSSSLCANCNAVCSTQTCSTSNYVHFYCTKCRIKESVRKNTFLYNKVKFTALLENVFFFIK